MSYSLPKTFNEREVTLQEPLVLIHGILFCLKGKKYVTDYDIGSSVVSRTCGFWWKSIGMSCRFRLTTWWWTCRRQVEADNSDIAQWRFHLLRPKSISSTRFSNIRQNDPSSRKTCLFFSSYYMENWRSTGIYPWSTLPWMSWKAWLLSLPTYCTVIFNSPNVEEAQSDITCVGWQVAFIDLFSRYHVSVTAHGEIGQRRGRGFERTVKIWGRKILTVSNRFGVKIQTKKPTHKKKTYGQSITEVARYNTAV